MATNRKTPSKKSAPRRKSAVAKNRAELLDQAARQLQSYLKNPVSGVFQQAWDRLNEAGFDVDLRREPNEENARALLWIAQNRKSKDHFPGDEDLHEVVDAEEKGTPAWEMPKAPHCAHALAKTVEHFRAWKDFLAEEEPMFSPDNAVKTYLKDKLEPIVDAALTKMEEMFGARYPETDMKALLGEVEDKAELDDEAVTKDDDLEVIEADLEDEVLEADLDDVEDKDEVRDDAGDAIERDGDDMTEADADRIVDEATEEILERYETTGKGRKKSLSLKKAGSKWFVKEATADGEELHGPYKDLDEATEAKAEMEEKGYPIQPGESVRVRSTGKVDRVSSVQQDPQRPTDPIIHLQGGGVARATEVEFLGMGYNGKDYDRLEEMSADDDLVEMKDGEDPMAEESLAGMELKDSADDALEETKDFPDDAEEKAAMTITGNMLPTGTEVRLVNDGVHPWVLETTTAPKDLVRFFKTDAEARQWAESRGLKVKGVYRRKGVVAKAPITPGERVRIRATRQEDKIVSVQQDPSRPNDPILHLENNGVARATEVEFLGMGKDSGEDPFLKELKKTLADGIFSATGRRVGLN